ncbi:MAG: carbohydrate kinase [Demequinaceae bacterium]|nr:carbohydrate kinase [Demequinaceae bacterium]
MSGHALVIGEALIDVVRRSDGSETSHPGGSPANVALALGRLHRQVELLTWIALDDHGRLIREHLEASGVSLVRGSESAIHTPVARAFIDESGGAQYDFDLSWAINPGAAPTRKPLIVHTGSLGAILPPGAATVRSLIESHSATATITYDPNVRPALMGNRITAMKQIEQLVELADIVKVSDEDLEWLDPEQPPNGLARQWLEMGPSIIVVTRGSKGATAFIADGRKIDATAPQVPVADTVGAGDSFMAGLIDGLWSQGYMGAENRVMLPAVTTDVITYVLNRCVGIAAITVSREGADPPTKEDLGEA